MNYISHCWSSCQQREGIGCHATSYMNVLCDDRGTCPWEFSSYAWYMCHNSLWLYAALMGVGLITNFHWKTPSRTKFLATCSGPSTLFICGLVSLYSISEELLWTLTLSHTFVPEYILPKDPFRDSEEHPVTCNMEEKFSFCDLVHVDWARYWDIHTYEHWNHIIIPPSFFWGGGDVYTISWQLPSLGF